MQMNSEAWLDTQPLPEAKAPKPKKPREPAVKKAVTKKTKRMLKNVKAAAKKPATRAAKRVRKLVKKAAKKKAKPTASVVRFERLDLRLSKAEKAKLTAKAVKARRTITSVVLELIEKMK